MTEKTTFNFWNLLGKFALLIGLLWTLLQIHNWYSEDDGFNFSSTGSHSKFDIPSDYESVISNYEETLNLDKAYREVVNSKGLSVNKLLDYYEKTKNKELIERYKFLKKYSGVINLPSYNSSWVFKIDNTGNKPLEKLILETPFNGLYNVSSKNGETVSGKFNKNIELPELNPGYSLNIRIWINESSFLYDYIDEEKTRVTHKYGFKQINYPVKVNGFTKWLTSYDYLPMQAGIVLLLFLLFFTFILGVESYPAIAAREKKREVEAFKKTQEIKELLEREESERQIDDNLNDS